MNPGPLPPPPLPARLAALLGAGLLLAATLASAAHAGTIRVVTQDPAGAPVADSVASLDPIGVPPPTLVPPADPVSIIQIDEEFEPYVTPVVAGTRVIFPNRDRVQHHVYSVSPPKRFEIPLYIGDPGRVIVFDKPGVVTLGCNIHDWMIAYVIVLETPYFVKTGADGSGVITAVPAGRYRLSVWNPRLSAPVEREVDVSGEGVVQIVSITLRPDRRIRRAPDATDAGYR